MNIKEEGVLGLGISSEQRKEGGVLEKERGEGLRERVSYVMCSVCSVKIGHGGTYSIN